MISLLLTSVSSCRNNDPPKRASDPVMLDADGVKARSHAFADAIDRENADALAPMLGTSFVRFEHGHTNDRRLLLDAVRASGERHRSAVTRTWSEEHVTLGDGTATFIGAAVERFPPANAGEPGKSLEFWNTLVWVREAADWKVAYWHIERIASARESWNDAFRSGALFQHEPNQLLVDTVKGRPPGSALDIAMAKVETQSTLRHRAGRSRGSTSRTRAFASRRRPRRGETCRSRPLRPTWTRGTSASPAGTSSR
jgi:hypothetical protein